MINNDRIVPVQKIDLLTLYGTIMTLAGTEYTVLPAMDIEGDFVVAEAGTYLANQPVKSLEFGEEVESGTVYFVPAYDYAGITAANAGGGGGGKIATRSSVPDETTEIGVQPDGVTLYVAMFAEGEVKISAISPVGDLAGTPVPASDDDQGGGGGIM